MKTILRFIKTAFAVIIISVALSTLINAHYRPIQEVLHSGIDYIYEKNEKLGKLLFDINGVIFNGKGFDLERSYKHAIFTSYKKTVLINVIPSNPEDVASRKLAGRGTGFFVDVTDEYGTFITNHHVIESFLKSDGKMKVTVNTAMDMWDYDAEILGFDQVADIAVLKIYKKDDEEWKAFEFAGTDDVEVGSPVIVLGHGFGLPYTATTGIISYTSRYGQRPYSLMLQTNAIINQGNSGGPIVGTNEKVVGVAQSILSPGRQTPGWDGVGMGVSAVQAKRSYEYIISEKYKETGYVPYVEFPFVLGTFTLEEIVDIDKSERHYSYIDYRDQTENATITVGQDAGLQQNDIILEINGENIETSFQVLKMSFDAFPGDLWKVKVKRGEETITVNVVLREIDREKLLRSLRD